MQRSSSVENLSRKVPATRRPKAQSAELTASDPDSRRVCAKVALMSTRGGIGWPFVAEADGSISSSTSPGKSSVDRPLTSATILCPPHRTNPLRNGVPDYAPFVAILLDLPLAGTGTFGPVDRSPHRPPTTVGPRMARFISTPIFRALATTPSIFAPECSMRRVSGQKMIVLCTYSLQASMAVDMLDVARTHQCTITRRNGDWEFLETPELTQAKREIKKLNGTLDILSKPFSDHELLTPRERATLAQIVSGASSKEAARALGIGPRTVEFHRKNIMLKLGAKNTVDLVRRVLGE
jgi:DNA-binding CsgD family transcriptional regulator